MGKQYENKNYSNLRKEQSLYPNEPGNQRAMKRRYISSAEKQVYRKLVTLAIITVIIIIVLFFWGLPILARLAGILTFLPAGDRTKPEDVIPPFPARLEELPIATNSAKIKLTGFAEPESTLEIFLNGALAQKLLIKSDGKFEIENFSLSYGENNIQLKSTDQAGNSSPITEQQVIYDNTSPDLEISEPATGSLFYGSQNLVKISGKTESGATVLVNGFLAIVDQDGKFTLTYPAQAGENRLEVTAQDAAGNQTKKFLTIYYTP